MEAPIEEKFKIDDDTKIRVGLEILQSHVQQNCLCRITQDISGSIFAEFHDAVDLLQPNTISDWSRDMILMWISTIQLTCDVALRQFTERCVCAKIVQLCEIFISDENNFVNCLIEFANHRDKFVCFSASRTLSSLFLISKSQLNASWLDKLVENILFSSYAHHKVSFSLDVIKHVIEWKDNDKHVLHVNDHSKTVCHGTRSVHSCQTTPMIELSDCDHFDRMEAKCLCIKSLETKWSSIVNRFNNLIGSPSVVVTYQSEIVAFLDLWRAIISVRANYLSVIDSKTFYLNLNSFVPLLTMPDIPLIVRLHVCDLFSAILCYGSTLASQKVLAEEESCSLATLIVCSIKNSQWLSTISRSRNNNNFRSGAGDAIKNGSTAHDDINNANNRLLLRNVVLIVLQAVAITVKKTRYDLSGESSLGSEADYVNADISLTERSIGEVLKLLDCYVKSSLPFDRKTVLAQWVVQLYSDQDEAMIESMLCCLDVNTVFRYQENDVVSDLSRMLNPTISFVQFLQTISFEFDALLDFLLSNETCFLLYMLRFLKYACRHWQEFSSTCDPQMDETMTVLIRLRMDIERLVSKDLFPYNVNPLLRLLSRCEQLYQHL